MRFFVSGPRIFGVRPGVIFGASDVRRLLSKTSPSQMTGSFVYVVEGRPGEVKIGVTRDPNRRLAQLQTGSSERLRFSFIGVTPGEGYDIEGQVHQTLDRHRVGGEWFRIPPAIAVGAINSVAYHIGQPIQQIDASVADQIIQIASQGEPTRADSIMLRHPVGFLLIFMLVFTTIFTMLIHSLRG